MTSGSTREDAMVDRSASIEVRPAIIADIEGAWHCVDVVARERAYLSFLEAPPLEDSRSFWSALIENRSPFEVAVDCGRIVGWCDITPISRPIFSHIGVLGMGLLPSHRSAGIGRRLLAAALKRARERGMERVELNVLSENVRARRLYENLGFVVEGTRPRRAKIDGQYRDDIMMALALDR